MLKRAIAKNVRCFSSIAPPSRLKDYSAAVVFSEFSKLAMDVGAVNLGQGFPDFEPPAFVLEAVKSAVDDGHVQYCPPAGHPQLLETLGSFYSKRLGRLVDSGSEIAVTVGATGGIFTVMQALVEPGEEVVVIEPAYDSYGPAISSAGGKIVRVPMELKDGISGGVSDVFELNVDKVVEAIGPNTRVVMLNTPHNPTGRLLTREELEAIGTAVSKHPRAVVVVDEVYESIAFTEQGHVRAASIPSLANRCLTVSSIGKTFSCTGFKIGWVVGPASLIKNVVLVNQWTQFCVTTPLQIASATCLRRADSPYEGHDTYHHFVSDLYRKNRDLLVEGLDSVGFSPIIPDGGFFVMAKIPQNILQKIPKSYRETPTPACPEMTQDWAFCRWMTHDARVAAIPPSAFFKHPQDKARVQNLARFAYCKEPSSIKAGIERLQKWFDQLN